MDKAGIPYIILFLVIAVFGIFIGNIIGAVLCIVGFIALAFTAFFFRDPMRKMPDDENAILSPADGRIVAIDNTNDDDIGSAQKIAIFMSPLDVHVNRSPAKGKVISVQHFPGKFHRAYLAEASIENERVDMLMESPWGKLRVIQIAGIIARRVVCRAKVNDELKKGRKYGIIHFGSRVELIVPDGLELTVKNGQNVAAGETIIAKWKKGE